MAFWSGERLLVELPRYIYPFCKDQIDCASYTLKVGGEVYVSPSENVNEESARSVRKLEVGDAIRIPPGQFAFLLTDETVTVPEDAIAFISMKSGIKFRGLVNVSGFHVDPGYRGRLVFSVLNAGPSTIHLRRGDPCFLIYYAQLDQVSTYTKNRRGRMSIEAALVTNVSGEFKTIEALSERLDATERSLTDRVHAVERDQAEIKTRLIVLFAVLIAAVTIFAKVTFPPASTTQPPIPSVAPTSVH